MLQRVEIASKPPSFARAIHGKGAIRDGLLYQQKITNLFESLYGFEYLSDLWINYYLGNDFHTCSPDGVLIDLKGGRIVIVEVKRTHTSKSFLKLRNVYLPVLQKGLSQRCGMAPRGFPQSVEGRVGGGYAGFLPPTRKHSLAFGETGSSSLWKFYLVEVCPAFDPLDSGGETIHLSKSLQNLISFEEGVNVVTIKKEVSRWNKR